MAYIYLGEKEKADYFLRKYTEISAEVMLTTYKELNIARRALYHGASGYILKNADIDEMLTGIEAVSNGEQFLCEEIAEGLTSGQIAARLSIHKDTIKTYRDNLFAKIKVRNMAELIKKACEMRLIR
ncbi:MAG: LuxR C-terminal-related transcriptional regulator [Tannerellaceae bacterium]|nr:LuxR C-terminal-related transcriptional regulator [Tannerellaceae bacterium]